jgi:NhaP-type Na+/H+ and K+/H+ antiporter
MIEGNSFVEIAAILGLATVTGIIGQKLRQPLIIMFLATGILAGPAGLGVVQSYEQIKFADLRFRQKYGVTMIGIRRGEKQISTIVPSERILADDTLIIIGKARTVEALKERQPL